MSKQRDQRRQQRTAGRRSGGDRSPPEDRAAEAITIAWTVSATAVFMADVVTIASHFYSRAHPESKAAPAFEVIMLLTASVLGAVSLALLPVVWRVRTVKPPQGFVAFAALVGAAPIAATIGRLLA
jgi:hypothetical protein